MYLLPARPVTSPLHPPPIFRIPQLMYLKRQRDSVPRETTFSGSDSALSTGGCDAREHRVSCQRRRQPISLSYLLIVTSSSFLMGRFLGLISETIVESCRGIIMSLWGCCFFKTQTERMTEQEAHHKENTSPQRGIAHPPKQNAVREEHLSAFQFGTINDTRFNTSQNSHMAFFMFGAKIKKQREAL